MNVIAEAVNAAVLSGGVQVRALHSCPHISHVGALPIAVPLCEECGLGGEVWTCIECGHVGCGRDAGAHSLAHFNGGGGHPLVLGNADLSVWCHSCEAYLDVFKIPLLHAAFDAAHLTRFGVCADLPRRREESKEESEAASRR